MELQLLAGCFLFVLATVLGGGYWFLKQQERAVADAEATGKLYVNLEDSPLRETLEKIGGMVPMAQDLEHPIRRKLIAAGYRDPDAFRAFFGIKAISGLTVGLALAVLSVLVGTSLGILLLCMVCGAGIGYMLPERFLWMLEEQRRERVRQALPAAIDLMVLSIEAGQSLDVAMLETGRELQAVYPDLSEEFSLAHLESRAGQSRADVLSRLAQRTREPDLRKLTDLLLDGDRFGTSLGPALRNHAEYTRLRRKQQAQEAARKTGVKLVFPVFFLIFPCVLLVTLGPAVLRLMGSFGQLLGE
jgi:tight adherence protein C